MFEYVKDLNYDDKEVVKAVAESYKDFVHWNKSKFDFEIVETEHSLKEVFIVHNIYEEFTLDCGYDFITEVYALLNDYVEGYQNDQEAIEDVEVFFKHFDNDLKWWKPYN